MGLPLKNWVMPLKNMGLPLKNFVKIKASPPKNSIFFYSTPIEILNFITCPWRIPWFLNQGGADIKCNSPLANYTLNSKIFLVSRNEAVRDRGLNPLMALKPVKIFSSKISLVFHANKLHNCKYPKKWGEANQNIIKQRRSLGKG